MDIRAHRGLEPRSIVCKNEIPYMAFMLACISSKFDIGAFLRRYAFVSSLLPHDSADSALKQTLAKV
jgi:hypothetical protein